MPLILPNSIENDTPADGAELQQNFSTIQTYVNTNLLDRSGTVALTNPLVLPGDPTQPNHAANKDYVDDRVLKSGDTMTGALIVETAQIGKRTDAATQALFSHKDAALSAVGFGCLSDGTTQTVTADGKAFIIYNRVGSTYQASATVVGTAANFYVPVYINDPQPAAANALTRKDYVDDVRTDSLPKAGGTMTGTLYVKPGTDGCIYLAATNPIILFYNDALTTQYGYLQGLADQMRLVSHGHIGFYSNGSERMRLTEGGILCIGKGASDPNNSGTELPGTGSGLEGRISSTTSTTPAYANFTARHISAADGNGEHYAIFQRNTAGITAGSITQYSGNNLIFQAGSGGQFLSTSDYRLKNDLGPVVDAADRVMQLQPKHLEWKPVSGTVGEFDGFIAHELAEVVPEAVVGDKDDIYPDDHPTNPGEIKAQATDNSKLVPLLTAALQDAITRIDELTARIETLEAAA